MQTPVATPTSPQLPTYVDQPKNKSIDVIFSLWWACFSIHTKRMQQKLQHSYALLAARMLAVCAPPALPPATTNRPGSGAFPAYLSLYGSSAVAAGRTTYLSRFLGHLSWILVMLFSTVHEGGRCITSTNTLSAQCVVLH